MLRILALLWLLFSTNIYALTFVCPNTYQTVMTGNSAQQVEQACGKPTDSKTIDQQDNSPLTSEQWVYTTSVNLPQNIVPQAVTTTINNNNRSQLLVTFDGDLVSEIVASNEDNSTTFYCYRAQRISIGSSKSDVQTQCGTPTFINKIQRGNSKTVQLSQWTYNYGPYRPQMIFIFKENDLIDIKVGQMGK